MSAMHKLVAHSKLSSLKSQIEQMENATAILKEPLECARIEYRRIENQLAPISSLLDELLSIIFEVGCDLTSIDWPEIPFEIWISQVSHHWRNVALATSCLWTNVVLGRNARKANVYLQRSKGSALRLSVCINEIYHTQEDIASFGRLVALHAGRLHYIDIVCNRRKGFNILLDSLPSAVPLLRQLTVGHSGHDGIGDDESTTPRRVFVDGAPCLTTFLLRRATLLDCIPPLTNVTHLRIDQNPLTSSIFRSLLTGPSTLTHLVIKQSIVDPLAVGTIELRSLRTLHLGYLDGILGLLAIVSAPSLEHLTLETLSLVDIDTITALGAPASKYPSLRSLTVLPFSNMRINILSSTWRLLIGVFPTTVTHFTLSYDKLQSFLESMDEQTYPLESPDASPLWPQLHTLTLLGPLTHSTVSLVRNVIEARIALGYPIQKLQLSHPIAFILKHDLQWLRAHSELEECARFPELIPSPLIIN